LYCAHSYIESKYTSSALETVISPLYPIADPAALPAVGEGVIAYQRNLHEPRNIRQQTSRLTKVGKHRD
jgi:hypothetical protein